MESISLSLKLYCKETWEFKGKLLTTMESIFTSLKPYWKETWEFKDDSQIAVDPTSSIDVWFGNEKKELPLIEEYNMINWKSSVDVMYDRHSTHFFKPHGTLRASLFVPKFGIRANYHHAYPPADPQEVEMEYLSLKHWILKLKLPLDQNPTRAYAFTVIPRLNAFSIPLEMTLKRNVDKTYTVANWSVGFTREAPAVSWILTLSHVKKKKQTTEGIEIIEERSTTATCSVEFPYLSVSTSLDKDAFKCSLELEDGDLCYTSKAHFDFEGAEGNVCSVGLRKKIDETKGLEVVFDTNKTSTVNFTDKKIKFKVSATVDGRDLNDSHISASFTFP